ncbi:MAG: LmeA family phospholipid-binding protein [Burkholderiaceae bacterium]
MGLRFDVLSSALICSALWLGGCAATMDARVGRAIASELPKVVGPAAHYDVDVEGARDNGEIAEIRRVHVIGTRVQREKSPVIDQIEVTMSDVVFNRKEKRLLSLGAADANVRLLPSDIAAFLDARPGLDNVIVTLYPPYEIAIETQFAVAGFVLPRATNAKIRGRLVVSDGVLKMEVVDLRVAGFPVGAIPTVIVERLINPLVDLSAPPAAARIASVQVTPDSVLLTASSALSSSGSLTIACARLEVICN